MPPPQSSTPVVGHGESHGGAGGTGGSMKVPWAHWGFHGGAPRRGEEGGRWRVALLIYKRGAWCSYGTAHLRFFYVAELPPRMGVLLPWVVPCWVYHAARRK